MRTYQTIYTFTDSRGTSENKGVNTPSVNRRVKREASDWIHWNHYVQGDAWEWVWDRFWSITMHSNGTLLDAPLDAQCGYR